MTTSLSEDVDFGTSTSVSGDWANGDDENLSADPLSLAMLMVTITGQEPLIGKIGAGETQQAVDRCIKRVIRAAESYGGRTIETRQSEIIVEFGQSDTALQAAIEMQNRVAVLPPVSGTRLTLRIGLSHGPVVESGISPFGAVAETASSLSRLAEPGQIVACIRAQAALSPELKERFDAYNLEWKKSGTATLDPLSEIPAAPENIPAATTQTREDGEQQPRCLMLKFDGDIFLLDDSNPVITIGRHADSHVVLKGNHASRHHASIQRRGNKVILTDTSTNGTFVSFNSAPPHLLVIKGECILHGTGVLSFSTSNPDTGIGTTSAKFEVFSKARKKTPHSAEKELEFS